mmetsp:Transcript_2810/g.8576  ORF Transcript_2810/g.8576 Transcript_2810/m.8576 type:complete len:508 (-) Transcript_2810:164-1687(-)|eukprot:CAMPEP_0198727512 /NCGR_PEP_ID=MMETSP1475-20131203/4328_1 /TAXON_ID= ORGANISM="Unidentified sp., Strain CCMP1999" /NCGR_SAMPLE_ID=MMETSP1475 /ASSEMBLY_ACC=CAM_ASM_001111 /LENGTH=507 /DNA_ID=CAMNT_0044489561 /DNA_START=38 /DNA_END=1561 /DNA_ORIENTATION=-
MSLAELSAEVASLRDSLTLTSYVPRGAEDAAATFVGDAVLSHRGELEEVHFVNTTLFILFSGYLVFFMQCGFAMLTAGSVRTKNTKNVLLKNLLDACVGAIGYYLFGYAFAYGNDSNPFIGHDNFALSGIPPSELHEFFFQWTFAATAATIVSGSVAERTSFYAYLGYAFFLTSFVYPVVSHWVWGGGWLGSLFEVGVIDFAGCSVVHMVGGFAGLMGAAIVGPRMGRFDTEGNVIPMPGHSATLCTLGTFILWFGWYGFNPGSQLSAASNADANTIARCAVNTTLAAAAAGLTTLVIVKLKDHIYDLLAVLNGTLAGLVSITASCFGVEPYAAIAIGFIGALIYMGAAWLLLKLKIDDPLEAFPIHGACGAWGAFAVGLFVAPWAQAEAGMGTNDDGEVIHTGAFYENPRTGGRSGTLLGANCIAIISIAAWTCGLIGPFFILMKVLGILRISPEDEVLGNDVSKHGGSAYPDDPIESQKLNKDNLGVDNSLSQPYTTAKVVDEEP